MKSYKSFCLILTLMLLVSGCMKKPDTISLHRAVDEGMIEYVRALIANGADINAQNNRGHTPLDKAIRCGHQDVIELLKMHASIIETKAGQ